ncbi:hypothetical protein D3H65_03585 [Paraflavitalea soli]|uniref:Beta-lactamase-related domain-containing protein n=1 Tax=Paraflavitalea soli TaxID=2315862 RepID=A0A3B7MHP4_9BACT|nr:serine hydrolase [Paraflavitalea soli]AXY73107.1 hypothetical protein D3H65_03585 [Paraflavitalea soli]
MLRFLLLLSLLITYCFHSPAQDTPWTVTGQVKDNHQIPLAGASVRLVTKGTGTLTNQAGNFLLKIRGAAANDTLEVTHLGFHPLRVAVAGIDKSKPVDFQLTPLPQALQKVVVKPINPLELLENAQKRIADNYFTTPHITRGFYRIDTKKGEEHIMLSEAVFDIYNFGYTSSKTNQFQLLKMRSIQDEQASHGIDLGLKPKDLYELDIIKQLAASELLSKEGIKKHQFTLRGVMQYNGREAYQLLFDQKEGINESLFKGRILIDVESLAFISVQMARSPRGMAYCKYGDAGTRALMKIIGLNIDVRKEAWDITYRPYGGKWILSTVRNDNVLNFKSNRAFYDFPADITVDYIVTDIDTLPANSFSGKETLGNNKLIEFQQTDNTSQFWKDYNILLPDYNTEAIAQAIGERNEAFSLKGSMESRLRKIKGNEGVRIDSICQYYHNRGSFNGSVLIKYKGNTILSKGYGMANQEQGIPATDSTQYRIGSLTKSFTAQLILQLVQEKKLDLQDTIGQFFPAHVHGAVTIAQLLTHTSGIPSYTKNEGYTAKIISQAYSLPELVNAFCSDASEFRPGSRFSYTNSGYLLLAAIIEKVTRQSYGKQLQERIFTPAGMDHSGFGLTTLNSTGYWLGQPEPVYPITNVAGAGGIATTVTDLMKWDATAG